MPGRAAKVTITERQKDALELMVRSGSTPQALVQRCRIILLAFDGHDCESIAQEVGLGRHQVGVWRKRWKENWEATIAQEFGSQAQLQKAIAEVLADEQRTGCHGKFTAEQVTQIVAVACEKPEDSGRPITHWSPRELAEEVQQREIVESISVRHVGRFLKSGRLETASC